MFPPRFSDAVHSDFLRDIAALTGLTLDQLVAADRMPIAAALPAARVTSTWRELRSPEDLDLDFDLEG